MIFISLDYSPWSDKARWALDYAGVPYDNKAYLSMVGEPWLRLKTKKFRGPVTVPVLIDGKETLTDSYHIALYADRHLRKKNQDGQTRGNVNKPSLFPCLESAKKWNTLSESALAVGRYRCVVKQLENPQAQQEILPPFIPGPAKSYFTWLAKNGLRYHLKKYPSDANGEAHYRDCLRQLRAVLNGKAYIHEHFSYSDIVMALALQYLKPVSHRYSVQGPAAESCWSQPELHAEFADLIEWRDGLYRKHR